MAVASASRLRHFQRLAGVQPCGLCVFQIVGNGGAAAGEFAHVELGEILRRGSRIDQCGVEGRKLLLQQAHPGFRFADLLLQRANVLAPLRAGLALRLGVLAAIRLRFARLVATEDEVDVVLHRPGVFGRRTTMCRSWLIRMTAPS